ncbi:hypothetical protein SFRURICE_011279 [Spodoptera frugiperda]|nr:hypothetical protein SFRURICE_011279 [Spodoptera frugiperda]
MGPSRADARSGAADNVTGYQGSGSKQEKEQGDFNFGVKLGAKQNRSRVVYKLLIERKPTLLLDATPGLHIRESPKGPVEYQRKALSCTC